MDNTNSMMERLDEFLLDVQKPSRYIGGETGSVVKDKSKVDIRFAFCFPDTYEIGMSHLGMKILYGLKNAVPNYWCERVFMPLPDMEEQMRARDIPLYALESLDPIKDFDFIGFTLQYEMSYTNVLEMLDLAGVPVLASEREGLTPIVMAGGPCVCNPEPLVDFFDLFAIGEGRGDEPRADAPDGGLQEGRHDPAGIPAPRRPDRGNIRSVAVRRGLQRGRHRKIDNGEGRRPRKGQKAHYKGLRQGIRAG